MNGQDVKAFTEMIQALSEVYKNPLSKFAIKIYWNALKGYPLESLLKAGESLAKSLRWMPKPADFVEAIDGGVGDRSAHAWHKVKRAIEDVGAYRSVVFDDPLIHATVMSMGTWPEICRTPIKELPFVAKRFESTYRAAEQNPPESHQGKLIGISDGGNMGRHDGHVRPPVMIGDVKRAAEVLRIGEIGGGGGHRSLPGSLLGGIG